MNINKQIYQVCKLKERLTIYNPTIMNVIIEKQKQDHKNTYILNCMQIQENALTKSG